MKSNNIILLGYKGVGKTTLGKQLASLLQFDFLDLDHFFAQTHQMTVKAYVASFGMAGFRGLEADLIQTLPSISARVIACGGGVVEHQTNIKHLKSLGWLIFLDDTYAAICSRLLNLEPLPVFVNPLHYELRRQQYLAAADYIYPLSGRSVETEAQQLLHFLRRKMDGI